MSKGAWKVTSNPVGDKTIYGVYRIIDPDEVNHSGNREIYGDYMDNREEAEVLAEVLNRTEA